MPLAHGFTFTPYVALNETRMTLSPMSETGAGAVNIDTVYGADSYLTLQPGFELGGSLNSRGWIVRPHLDVFATQFIGNNSTSLPELLEGQPSWLGPLTFNNEIDRTLWNLSPTIDVEGHGVFGLSFHVSRRQPDLLANRLG